MVQETPLKYRAADTHTARRATAPPDMRSKSVREALRRKGLPDAQFACLWAGYGTHDPCDRCGQVIAEDQVEYELEFRQGAGIARLKLHFECWEIWREE
jgi:hypothetical protein